MEKEMRTIKVDLPQDIKRGEILRIDIDGHVLLFAYKKKNSDVIHPLCALDGWGDQVMSVEDYDEIMDELQA